MLMTANTYFENAENFKYLGTTPTNQNWVPKEIKSNLKVDNAYLHSVQNIYSTCLLSKTVKI